MRQTVAIVGNLSDGFRVIGPFESYESAERASLEWDESSGLLADTTLFAGMEPPDVYARERNGYCDCCKWPEHDVCDLNVGCPCCDATARQIEAEG